MSPSDYHIKGSRVVRGAGASSAALYVQLVGNAGQAIPSGTEVVVAMNTPIDDTTQPPMLDPAALVSTTTLDGLGSGDIPAGSAVVMTAASAGIWLVNSATKINIGSPGDPVNGDRRHAVYVNAAIRHLGTVYDQDNAASAAPQGSISEGAKLTPLLEGDYVWMSADGNSSDAGDLSLEKAILTMVRIAGLPA